MGAQQPRIPNQAVIPETWELLIDLEDYFFTIALDPDDAPHFAFPLPSLNNSEPMQRHRWIVLPQGMKKSYNMPACGHKCFTISAAAILMVLLCHYMDDRLLTVDDSFLLQNCLAFLGLSLDKFGLCIAADEVQTVLPWKYVGFLLFEQKIIPRSIVLRTSSKTLHDLQNLLGITNWLRPTLGIST